MQIRQQVSEYFLRLGTRVCDGLNRAGYPFCRGQSDGQQPALVPLPARLDFRF